MGQWLVSAENAVRRWHSWHIAVIALSLCAGCGGSVATGNASTGGAPGSGAPGSTAPSGGSGGGTYSGGAQGGDGGSGAVGGGGTQGSGPACKETYDHVEFSIVTASGQSYGCSNAPGGGTTNWSTTGIVEKTSPTQIVVDSCPPNAACAPARSTVGVKANGLSLSIPVGAIVSVDYIGPNQTEQIYAPCSGQLFIRSVGDWNGAHDPNGDGYLYLAAVDGSFAQPANVPYKIALAKLACSTYKPGGGIYAATGDYAFRFYSSPSFTDLVVPMGFTEFLVTKPQKLHVHNLRSFQSDGTDANWDWAYWVAP